jgi:hypothetical protein
MADSPGDQRPDLTPALEALLETIVVSSPALAGIKASGIVVVALGAHGPAVASIRPLGPFARSVRIGGRRRSIELGLRPGFFLAGDGPQRLATLCHELLHLDPGNDGALLDSNRHHARSQRSLDQQARRLAEDLIAAGPPTLALCLAHHGEVRLRAWRRRPCDTTPRSAFTDDDVFSAIVAMHTASDRRGGWW